MQQSLRSSVSRDRLHQSKERLGNVDEEEKKESGVNMSPHTWKNTLRETTKQQKKTGVVKPPLSN